MSILHSGIVVLLSFSYGTCVPSAEIVDDNVFPLLLRCDSSMSDLLEIRNNISILFLTSQINLAYLMIQFLVLVPGVDRRSPV